MTAKQPPTFTQRIRSFRRALELEARQGYADRAVVGGLGRFLDRWRAELTEDEAESLSASLKAALTQRAYHDMPPDTRERWVRQALTALDDQAAAAAPAPPDDAPPPSIPARRIARPTAEPTLDSPPTALRGVGTGLADKLRNLGIATIEGLLRHYPARHLPVTNVRDLEGGSETAIVGTVWEIGRRTMGRERQMQTVTAVLSDETGNVQVIWFNQPYIMRYIKAGDRLLCNGYFRPHRGIATLNASSYEVLHKDDPIAAGNLVPVYPATRGVTQRALRLMIGAALDTFLPQVSEPLPTEARKRLRLPSLVEALEAYHRPRSREDRDWARRRLAFDEMLVRQIALLQRRHTWQGAPAQRLPVRSETLRAYVDALPFALTRAQRRVLRETLDDLAEAKPAHRLIEGDVGSGKTVVALAAMLNAAANGYQAAMMAPTELLAEQHYQTVSRLLEPFAQPISAPNRLAFALPGVERPVTAALAIGSQPRGQKTALRRDARDGGVDLLVGTHALLQERVAIPQLAVAVIDEEHRFGVAQRRALAESSALRPHLISMSATPIPRSLALTVYGDLDISTIDEMPPGRLPTRTRWLRADQREQAYRFLRKEIAGGRQAFVICPIIDESDTLQVSAAVEEHGRLAAQVFPDLRVGLLHGRMKLAEKNAAMERFRAGELDILVSTPVVEVGVDIPNATVMMVEGAERFGLSALHQLRGRVGRGDAQGYCILMADTGSETTSERLSILEQETDGFRVAEADLRLRGPGELTGIRQSGLPDLQLADLHDTALVGEARAEAEAILRADPELTREEHSVLAGAVERLLARLNGDAA